MFVEKHSRGYLGASLNRSPSSWYKEYGGLKVNQAKRLKELEKENAWLKKLLVEPHLPTMLTSSSKVLSVVTAMVSGNLVLTDTQKTIAVSFK